VLRWGREETVRGKRRKIERGEGEKKLKKIRRKEERKKERKKEGKKERKKVN
jgi:hypothetical protein